MKPQLAHTVTITAACPECGHDATWNGHRSNTTSATDTTYQIDCPPCDRTWTLAQQIVRRVERIRNAVIERTAA